MSERGKIVKTKQEWEAQLSPIQFYILRQAGTEMAFTGPFLKEKGEGVYRCAGCGAPLFSSGTKFDSGTGWPSFYAPIRADAVSERKEGWLPRRTEVRCATCEGHLGHVFGDGPKPTGLRYCMNGYALEFEADSSSV
jgi:peptide-methionine (R)-S-oxide reductase